MPSPCPNPSVSGARMEPDSKAGGAPGVGSQVAGKRETGGQVKDLTDSHRDTQKCAEP